MRVIAGKYKRRNLKTAPGTDITRPTSDRIKESVFNILSPFLRDAVVLDLFAGSGALGIEALSRGAAHVIFVESNSIPLKFLLENLKNLAVPTENYTILRCDVEKFLENPTSAFFSARASSTFKAEHFAASISLVFADPPYASSWYDKALDSIEKSGLCQPSCQLILEMEAKHTTLAFAESWNLTDTRIYGKTRIEFWMRNLGGDKCGFEREQQ